MRGEDLNLRPLGYEGKPVGETRQVRAKPDRNGKQLWNRLCVRVGPDLQLNVHRTGTSAPKQHVRPEDWLLPMKEDQSPLDCSVPPRGKRGWGEALDWDIRRYPNVVVGFPVRYETFIGQPELPAVR